VFQLRVISYGKLEKKRKKKTLNRLHLLNEHCATVRPTVTVLHYIFDSKLF